MRWPTASCWPTAPPSSGPERRATEIADLALLSDCRTAALVTRDDSVDWWPGPRFDGPTAFARLLDPGAEGHEIGHEVPHALVRALAAADGDIDAAACGSRWSSCRA